MCLRGIWKRVIRTVLTSQNRHLTANQKKVQTNESLQKHPKGTKNSIKQFQVHLWINDQCVGLENILKLWFSYSLGSFSMFWHAFIIPFQRLRLVRIGVVQKWTWTIWYGRHPFRCVVADLFWLHRHWCNTASQELDVSERLLVNQQIHTHWIYWTDVYQYLYIYIYIVDSYLGRGCCSRTLVSLYIGPKFKPNRALVQQVPTRLKTPENL